MRASHPGTRQSRRLRLALGGLGLLVVCLLDGSDDQRAGLSCIDDSPDCVDQRQVTLKSMLADQDRKWVKEPRDAAGACLGRAAVRLSQPQEGAELRGAGARAAARPTACRKALRGPEGKSLSPAQISRANMFAAEVSKELAAEMRARRCKA